MRFLVDVCVSFHVAAYLEAEGHQILRVSDRDRHMADEDILRWAREAGYVLVTNDKDFGRHIFVHAQGHAGLIRIPNAPPDLLVSLLGQVLAKHLEDLAQGAIVTVTKDRIRVRRVLKEGGN